MRSTPQPAVHQHPKAAHAKAGQQVASRRGVSSHPPQAAPLWRAVDQHRAVLDILVHSRRNAKVTKQFLYKLLKGLQSVFRVIVTNTLRRYRATKREILPGDERQQGCYLSNRALQLDSRVAPRGESLSDGVAPTREATRTAHATVQISMTRATRPIHLNTRPQPLSAPPPSTNRQRTPWRPRCRFAYLAQGGRRRIRDARTCSAENPPRRFNPQPDNASQWFVMR